MSKAINEEINEERYQFVLSLYLIRTQYTQMGLFQPDFIWVTFRSMMPSKYNRNDDDIKKVVNEWCAGTVEAEVKYGHIRIRRSATLINKILAHFAFFCRQQVLSQLRQMNFISSLMMIVSNMIPNRQLS